MSIRVAAIVLAAGQGTRMQSSLPKVLHGCAGLPLIGHVLRRALSLGADPVVVVVSPTTRDPVQQAVSRLFAGAPLVFAQQAKPVGTGDAVRAGLVAVPQDIEHVAILYGDVPLLQADNLQRLQEAGKRVPLSLLTATVDDATGYGRVVRSPLGAVTHIVEHKDATEAELSIKEVNVGVYFCKQGLLRQTLTGLTANNAQQELYLTDIVAAAHKQGAVEAVPVTAVDDMRGVNSRVELSEVERIMQARLVHAHQLRGVTFLDPKRVYLGVDVELGRDVTVGVDVTLLGHTRVASDVRIDGPTSINNSIIEASAYIQAFSHLDGATVREHATVGPYARLRPGSDVGQAARVGNFVELKNATVLRGAKVNHLSYVGDASVGEGSNIGAGTITCNYDGVNKHRTTLGAGVFIGSNSTLVAPLNVADGAFVAAGSTITQDVPKDALAFGRARQALREGYAEVLRNKQAAAKKSKTT